MKGKAILITGGAGFIGSHLTEALLQREGEISVLDDFNDFYSSEVKEANLQKVIGQARFNLVRGDIRDRSLLEHLFSRWQFSIIVHLAARAGVRPSFHNAALYQDVNIGGTLNLLEAARRFRSQKFVFASSSSVYGNNPRQPWKETDLDLWPESPYAATKLIGEHLCRIYHLTYGMEIVILRFFTVYGPRQRPDMAIHKFSRLVEEGKKIPVFGDGTSCRDYTYIEDIIAGVMKVLEKNFQFEIFNLGGGHSVSLKKLVPKIGQLLGKPVYPENLPFQAGDVQSTWADISKARNLLNYQPCTPLAEGLKIFGAWFRSEREKCR